MNDLAKRRFDLLAQKIAEALLRFEESIRSINREGAELERLITDYLHAVERAGGVTPDTTRLRSEVTAIMQIFSDPSVMPALDAAKDHFDSTAVELGQLAGSLPPDPAQP